MPATANVLVRDVPTSLWERAKKKARGEGLTLRGLIVELLTRYVNGELTVR